MRLLCKIKYDDETKEKMLAHGNPKCFADVIEEWTVKAEKGLQEMKDIDPNDTELVNNMALAKELFFDKSEAVCKKILRKAESPEELHFSHTDP